MNASASGNPKSWSAIAALTKHCFRKELLNCYRRLHATARGRHATDEQTVGEPSVGDVTPKRLYCAPVVIKLHRTHLT